MDRITELLARLSELSDGELSELEGLVLSEFETIEKADITSETVEHMTQLGDAAEGIQVEKQRRVEQAAELSRRKDDAAARIRALSEPQENPAEQVEENADAGLEGERQPALAEASTSAPAESTMSTTESAPAAAEASTPAAVPAPQAVAAAAGAEGPQPKDPSAEAGKSGEPLVPSLHSDTAKDGQLRLTEESQSEEKPAATASRNNAPEGEDTVDKEQATEPVTASSGYIGGELAEMDPSFQPPADRRPKPRAEATVAITAGADIPGVSAGSPLGDMNAVAHAFTQRMRTMSRTHGGDGEQHVVATLEANFPESRRLTASDANLNWNRIQEVVSPQAITAAGGICMPLEVRYDLFGLGALGRPVKDSLPSFNTTRGGIRFMQPPTLANLNGAVSLWTLQDDIDAATPGAPDPVKPCIRVNCGPEVQAFVDAIVLCLTFGNMGARAWPELVARHNELALIQHARFSETRLLTKIGTLSTAVTAARQLGAAVDHFVAIDRAVTTYRNRHRMVDNTPLRYMAPTWLRSLLRSDIAKRMPGDGLEDTLAVADNVIDRFFRSRSVNVTWFIDGEAGQMFGEQTPGALLDYPDNVIWYLFPEGTFLFLDGGTLDLGLVRDSTLNGTNDYKVFVETFEGVAKVGFESLRVTQRLEATGQVAGTVDTTPPATV